MTLLDDLRWVSPSWLGARAVDVELSAGIVEILRNVDVA